MLRIYNTLSRKKEIFRPRENKKVNLFVCGPTVYDFSHIGHARTYLVFDMVVNYLRWKGYKVFYLQNITDIDDKIIKRAKEMKISPKTLAKRFEKEYYKDMEKLKINSVTKYARATDHIKEIISQVKRLLEKGFAYKIEDGIYFDIKKFKDYGKLAKRTALQAEDAVSRIDESVKKRNKGDFCLWKFSKKGEIKWESPWGEGRPGWHIEDTAICEKYFGFQYDIHGGARDLIFPHHEAEIAQMESLSGKKPMVKYWMHSGFLTVKGKKMSKSLGNFITIGEFLKKYSPEVLRMFVFLRHYRSPIDFNEKNIKEAKESLERLEEFHQKIKEKMKNIKKEVKENKFLKKFTKYLEDDFNTPKFFSHIFKEIRKANKRIEKLSQREIKDFYSLLNFTDKIFKILTEKKVKIPKKVKILVLKREEYRKRKNWKKADKIREEIRKLGYKIEDTKEGPKIKKIN